MLKYWLGKIIDEIRPYVNCPEEHKEKVLHVLAKHRQVITLPNEAMVRTHLVDIPLKL